MFVCAVSCACCQTWNERFHFWMWIWLRCDWYCFKIWCSRCGFNELDGSTGSRFFFFQFVVSNQYQYQSIILIRLFFVQIEARGYAAKFLVGIKIDLVFARAVHVIIKKNTHFGCDFNFGMDFCGLFCDVDRGVLYRCTKSDRRLPIQVHWFRLHWFESNENEWTVKTTSNSTRFRRRRLDGGQWPRKIQINGI